MTSLSRRSFLKGSAYFAAALAMAASARAQDAAKPDSPRQDPPKQDPAKPAPEKPQPSPEKPKRKGPKTDEEIFAEQEKAREELVDDEGRQYRICPQCGFKMYRQGRTWTCSNCGFSYVE